MQKAKKGVAEEKSGSLQVPCKARDLGLVKTSANKSLKDRRDISPFSGAQVRVIFSFKARWI